MSCYTNIFKDYIILCACYAKSDDLKSMFILYLRIKEGLVFMYSFLKCIYDKFCYYMSFGAY